ncbi:MAG: DNA polymerase I [Verrucomicrobia bacterium]|nr:DNA polymerase I [Verrucomicrobiota bacterium]
MQNKLFLLDGMALVYRAHFALIRRPIFTSKGFNTSAIYGFTQTLLEIISRQSPTHLAVAFDTEAPTQRHKDYPLYKSQREAMPEDLSLALPHIRRMIEALNIPILIRDGFEADDIIGTMVRRAEAGNDGCISYMVTPDKDFGQLVNEQTFIYKPSRMGDDIEILGPSEILKKWGIERPEQVIDILALWGDVSDNIPGVPGIGEKTAAKLISQYGSVENLIAHSGELKGKLKESLESHREQALLSKRLATIICDVPIPEQLDDLKRRDPNDEEVASFCREFELNTIGRRLLGESFKAGHGFGVSEQALEPENRDSQTAAAPDTSPLREDLFAAQPKPADEIRAPESPVGVPLKTITDVPHDYRIASDRSARETLVTLLRKQPSVCFDTETTSLDPKGAELVGIAFSWEKHAGYFVPFPETASEAAAVLNEFRSFFEDENICKVGHNLKFDLSVLRWKGVSVHGTFFDTMLAHSLIEPEYRHSMDYLSEVYLGYSPVPIKALIGEKGAEQLNMRQVPLGALSEYAVEDADVTWQLRHALEPLLKEKGQERVFYEIESMLLPALVEMEFEGIRLDASTLEVFAEQLAKQIALCETRIHHLAGGTFNLNSPKQLGEVLFDVLKIADKPKKTKTGQYATNEQTLTALASEHEIVERILEYRAMTKLKSTYADTLPHSIFPSTGRVHTTYNQAMTATGRLQSQNPNLQNIPIRSALGQEIRRAFVPRESDWVLLAADYSQIELRIIAAISGDQAMLEAFSSGVDIHTATASRVYDLPLDQVSPEMRRKAKMVNFGIIYGISAFGLAQRLRIPRSEAGEIIDQYSKRYPGIQNYISTTIRVAKEKGYVETVTGRRRYLRDLTSANATVRGAAERNAINAPIQGTAADMIKIAMSNIHTELFLRKLRSRMLLQVHDELVFDLYKPEENEVRAMVEEKMRTAIPLQVPIVVEMGTGKNWLEAH